MLFSSKTKHPRRDVFANVFATKGLYAACRRSQTTKQRVLGAAGAAEVSAAVVLGDDVGSECGKGYGVRVVRIKVVR